MCVLINFDCCVLVGKQEERVGFVARDVLCCVVLGRKASGGQAPSPLFAAIHFGPMTSPPWTTVTAAAIQSPHRREGGERRGRTRAQKPKAQQKEAQALAAAVLSAGIVLAAVSRHWVCVFCCIQLSLGFSVHSSAPASQQPPLHPQPRCANRRLARFGKHCTAASASQHSRNTSPHHFSTRSYSWLLPQPPTKLHNDGCVGSSRQQPTETQKQMLPDDFITCSCSWSKTQQRPRNNCTTLDQLSVSPNTLQRPRRQYHLYSSTALIPGFFRNPV
jgi:hypothetical protein